VLVALGFGRGAVFSDTTQMLLLVLVSLGATGGAAFIGGELFVVRPIRALTHVTQQLASLDLKARAQIAIGVPGLPELGDAVNSMAAALDTHQRELSRAEQELRASEYLYRQF